METTESFFLSMCKMDCKSDHNYHFSHLPQCRDSSLRGQSRGTVSAHSVCLSSLPLHSQLPNRGKTSYGRTTINKNYELMCIAVLLTNVDQNYLKIR